jgi:uncharacterized membrane-anchored protein YhcB (DUF1043 family)
MDWIVGVLLLVVGAIIGFFVARYLSEGKAKQQDNGQTEQTRKEIAAQQASEHLNTARLSVQNLRKQCDSLENQLDNYQQLLTAQNEEPGKTQLSYFGEHASLYLRNKQGQEKREARTSEVQPRDFSSESSGLFSGSKNKQTES